MAGSDATDVLMMFEYEDDDPKRSGNGLVAAESTTQFEAAQFGKTSSGSWSKSKDPLMQDFIPGYFFEVGSFDFGVGVNDGESGDDDRASGAGRSKRTNALHGGKSDKENETGKAARASKKPRFSRFIYPPSISPNGQTPPLDYDIDVQPFKFTRQLDRASPIFFENCAKVRPFAKATLVKRKFTGNNNFHQAFLRMDFMHVLLTGVEWDDGEVIKETCSFVYRRLNVQYKPQKPDGTLDNPVPGEWKAKRKLVGSKSGA